MHRSFVPPLESGDRLDQTEFERRFDATRRLRKAELIDGVVYVGSPVACNRHGEPQFLLGASLAHFAMHTPGVRGAIGATIRMDRHNVPQPDVLSASTRSSAETAWTPRTATWKAPPSSSPRSPPAP